MTNDHFPPGPRGNRFFENNGFPNHRTGQWHVQFRSPDTCSSNGFIPCMERERKFPPMDRQQKICTEIHCCVNSLFRHEVNIGPCLIVLTAFQYDQIEWTITFSYSQNMIIITAISSNKYFDSIFLQNER